MSNAVISKVADLLRTEDDLDKLDVLTRDLAKEKSTLDSQVQIEQDRGLDNVQSIINNMQLANKHLKDLKYNAQKLDQLQKDSMADPNVTSIFDKSATALKNFDDVDTILQGFTQLSGKMRMIEDLMGMELPEGSEFYNETSSGDNLLIIHYGVNELLDFKDKVQTLTERSSPDVQQTASQWFGRLDNIVDRFDNMIAMLVDGFVDIVGNENYELIIKLAKIIQYEEKEDMKVELLHRLLDGGSSNNKKLLAASASKVKRTSTRGYRQLFEKDFERTISSSFEALVQNNDYENLIQVLDENYYDTMGMYQQAIDRCFPAEWNFFDKILRWHQASLRRIFTGVIESDQVSNSTVVAVLNFEYANKKKLKQLFNLDKKTVKEISILEDDKKEKLLESSLHFNETKTLEWVKNSLRPATDLFETRAKEPPDSKDDKLGIETAQMMIEILRSNISALLELGDSKVLLEYLQYFASDVMSYYFETWSTVLEQEAQKWNLLTPDGQEEDPTIGYMPRYITVLANDCVKLVDALDTQFKQVAGYIHESFHDQLEQIHTDAAGPALNLGTDALQKLSGFVRDEYRPFLNEVFTKKWYKSSSCVECSLQIVEESYMNPLQEYLDPELYISLFEMVYEDFLLSYLEALYNGHSIKKDKFTDKVERDGNQIQRSFSKYDSTGMVSDETLYILDILITLANADSPEEYIEEWQNAVKVFNDLPTDFLKVILENKGLRDSKVRRIVEQAQEVSDQIGDGAPTFMAKFKEP